MKAVRDKPTTAAEVSRCLASLLDGGINFVLLGDGKLGYSWYLPNVDGPEEHEDWIFHALRHGKAPTLDIAVEALAIAAAQLHPDSGFAKAHRTSALVCDGTREAQR